MERDEFMLLERILLIAAWVMTIIGVILSTRRDKIRDAWVIFMFKQTLTWPLGLLVVQYHLIEYPVREFEKANGTSFSFEFFLYPCLCIVFNLKFPENKSAFRKFLWYIFFPSWMTLVEVILEKYTDLIQYIHWTWHWTWITLLITFWLTRQFYLWFYRRIKVPSYRA